MVSKAWRGPVAGDLWQISVFVWRECCIMPFAQIQHPHRCWGRLCRTLKFHLLATLATLSLFSRSPKGCTSCKSCICTSVLMMRVPGGAWWSWGPRKRGHQRRSRRSTPVREYTSVKTLPTYVARFPDGVPSARVHTKERTHSTALVRSPKCHRTCTLLPTLARLISGS